MPHSFLLSQFSFEDHARADREHAVNAAPTETVELEFGTPGNESTFPESRLNAINLRFTMMLEPLRRIQNTPYKLTFPSYGIRSKI
ncbi:MAG: hypothetical protein ACPGLY_23820 [Rubripirellula sp.]